MTLVTAVYSVAQPAAVKREAMATETLALLFCSSSHWQRLNVGSFHRIHDEEVAQRTTGKLRRVGNGRCVLPFRVGDGAVIVLNSLRPPNRR